MDTAVARTTQSKVVPANFFKPSELLGIFRNYFASNGVNNKVLTLHGVYFRTEKVYGTLAYDKLKDENSTEEITLIVPVSLRNDLKNGNLVDVSGILDRKVQNNSSIQFYLNVTRVDKVRELAISEDDVKRNEALRKKNELGRKNVESILETRIFKDERPKVALVYADGSITDADFEKGLTAAKCAIDFCENRVSFANPAAFSALLANLDKQNFDVIAVVRGGGSGLEKLDDPKVCECLALLKTAWIYGVGHEKENLFIRNLADKVIPIPFALGVFFRDLVESVAERRNSSRAALVAVVRKQFEKQIEDGNRKNQELNKQLEALTKQSKEQSEAANKQNEAANKQNKELREQLDAITKQSKEQNEAAHKLNKELQNQLTEQIKSISDLKGTQKDLQERFTKTLDQAQKSNKELTDKVVGLTEQIAAAKDENARMQAALESKRATPKQITVAIGAICAAFALGLLL